MSNKINVIEIVFPVPVELSNNFIRALASLLDGLCEEYKLANPTRTMWPAGFGSKPLWREPEEPDFEDSVFQISMAERESYDR